jgi:hypothetical protein
MTQKEILKQIKKLPLRKFGSAKHNKLIAEYVKTTRFWKDRNVKERS